MYSPHASDVLRIYLLLQSGGGAWIANPACPRCVYAEPSLGHLPITQNHPHLAA